MLDNILMEKAEADVAGQRYKDAVGRAESIQIEKLCRGEEARVRKLFLSIPEEERAVSPTHCLQEIQLCLLSGETANIQRWYSRLLSMRDSVKEGSPARSELEKYINLAGILRPMTGDAKLLLLLAVMFNDSGAGPAERVYVSVTGKQPHIIHGRKDVLDWCQHYGAVTSIMRPLMKSSRSGYDSGVIECARGEMFYERGDLNDATMENAVALTSEDPEVLFASYALLARLYSLDPSAQNHERVLEHIGKILDEKGADWLLPNYNALRVRFSLLGGDTTEAEKWLSSCGSEWDGVVPDTYYEMATKARVYIALGRHREAMSLLQQLMSVLEGDVRPYDRAQCLAYEAVVCEQLGSEKEALQKLDEALHLMEPFGFVRVFADIGTQMLHLLLRYVKETAPQSSFARYVTKVTEAAKGYSLLWPRYLAAGAEGGESAEPVNFTAMEAQILQLLGDGKSNGEIADALSVKLPTVKFHLKNIYEKLDVSSRTAALSAAKKRNLL